jgi:hypothetical protein
MTAIPRKRQRRSGILMLFYGTAGFDCKRHRKAVAYIRVAIIGEQDMLARPAQVMTEECVDG